MRTAYLCDFDGTISPTDIGAALVRRFSVGDAAARRSRLTRWRSGRLGHRELSREECREMRASRADSLAYVRRFAIDPGFTKFVAEAHEDGDEVMVVSEGFDFYLNDRLAQAGLDELARASNRVRFRRDRWLPQFPFADPACRECGNCKAQHVRRYRARGFVTVLVGDGLSDRCGAREADAVLARRDSSLLTWCRSEGVRCRAFGNFREVAAIARARRRASLAQEA